MNTEYFRKNNSHPCRKTCTFLYVGTSTTIEIAWSTWTFCIKCNENWQDNVRFLKKWQYVLNIICSRNHEYIYNINIYFYDSSTLNVSSCWCPFSWKQRPYPLDISNGMAVALLHSGQTMPTEIERKEDYTINTLSSWIWCLANALQLNKI